MNALDVAAARAGDREAFARIVEATRHLVCTLAFVVCRNTAASEDVAQEVFVTAWRDLPSLRRVDSFLPWLKQLTRHRALNHQRGEKRGERRARQVSPPPPPEEASALLTREEESQALNACLEQLSDAERELLVLFYREGASIAQVASLLELSENAVKKRLERARRRLRQDVLARLADAAQKTAPAAAFSLGVAASLDSSAATAGAVAVKGSAFAGLALALAAGLGGVVLTFAVHAGGVRSPADRRELQRLSGISGALIIAWFASFVWLAARHAHPAALIAPYLLLVAAHAAMYTLWLPRLLRMEGAAVRRRYRLFIGVFAWGAATGIATLLWVVNSRA